MKKTKIIIPALGLLLLSTAASVTGTVAWFSANAVVNVTGMQVTTKVSSNLLVSADMTESNFKASLEQTRAGLLEPVSTVNGTSFYYHATNNNVNGDGSAANTTFVAYSEAAVADPSNALSNPGADKSNYDAAFQTNYGITGSITTSNVAYGYIDYSFYLKATSSADNQKLALTKCNLLYGNNDSDDDTWVALGENDLSWRVAILTAATTKGNLVSSGEANLSLLKLPSAANFGDKAVDSTSTTASVTYGTAATIDADIDAGVTKYYKVIVRLYLEGNDTHCTNETYATLTDEYKLDLAFSLGDATGLTAIQSNASL